MGITITDKMLREIYIIQNVFELQYYKYEKTNHFPYVFDSESNYDIEGRYINDLDICSTDNLFNLQNFKKIITERYENTNNLNLLKNQLNKIKQEAEIAIDLYNKKLTKGTKKVEEFNNFRNLLINGKTKLFRKHSAVLFVDNYQIFHLIFGSNRLTVDKNFNKSDYSFNYSSNNYELAFICQSVIDFIDYFNFSFSKEPENLKDYINKLLKVQLEHKIRYEGKYINYWRDKKYTNPKTETEIQQDIYNTLEPFCKHYNITIEREIYSANGSIDMYFERNNEKLCLEAKLAHHPDIETAITTQLPEYLDGKKTKKGIYLVFWFKTGNDKIPISQKDAKLWDEPRKYNSTYELKQVLEKNKPNGYDIDIKIINVSKPQTPSEIKPSKNKNIKA
ncbi:MAG: hypothetical protein K8R54_16430 [Bacteroidales bacterium]|nr:hypothetical protein [Bacteroidales bacterium]